MSNVQEVVETVRKVEIPPFEIDTIKWKGFSIEAKRIADEIIITDDEENGMALNTVKKIKEFGEKVEDGRKQYVNPLNEWVKFINGIFNPITTDIDSAEKVIKRKMLDFEQEKERVRREEEARLRKEHEEQVKKAQEEAKKNKTEPVIIAPPPKLMEEKSVKTEMAGASFISVWKAEVTDLKGLVKAILDGKAPIEAIQPDMSFLNKQAKSYKKDGVIAGVKFFEEKTVSVR